MKTFGEIFKEAESLFVENIKKENYTFERSDNRRVYLKMQDTEVCIWCSTQSWEYYQIFGENLRFPISDETKKMLCGIFGNPNSESVRLRDRLDELNAEKTQIEERLKNIKCDTTKEN